MGLRTGAWATCWDIEVKSDTLTQARISISKKDRQTGEYVQDWSGYLAFVGTNNAKKAAALKPKDRIKLGEIEETSKYDKEKNITYYNRWCYSFETQAETEGSNTEKSTEPQPAVDEGVDGGRLLW